MRLAPVEAVADLPLVDSIFCRDRASEVITIKLTRPKNQAARKIPHKSNLITLNTIRGKSRHSCKALPANRSTRLVSAASATFDSTAVGNT